MAYDFEVTAPDRIYTPISAIAEPFTMSCWAIVDSTSTGIIMGVGDSGSTYYHGLRVRSFGFVSALSVAGSVYESEASQSMSSWTSVVGVWASTSSRQIFHNGTAGTAETSSATITENRISVGVSPDSTPFGDWNGKIAEVAVWTAALGQTEIDALAAGYSPLFIRPDKLLYYRPCVNINADVERMGAASAAETVGNPINYPHPRIIYPSAQILHFPSGAAPPSATPKGPLGLPLEGVFGGPI